MKQKIQLQIPTPCHEDWDNMTATQQGRFCMSCQKEVIDFSVMTDKEILRYISTASGNTCGRIANDQLNRDLVPPPEPRKIWWKYWMSIAASVIMLSAKSTAQDRVIKTPAVAEPVPLKKGDTVMIRLGGISSIKKDAIKTKILGRVVDEENVPVPYASIKIVDGKGIAADSSGNFELNTTADVSNLQLVVSSVGYQTNNLQVDKPGNIKTIEVENGVIKMIVGNIQLKMQSLGGVTVTGYGMKGKYVIAGGISFCRKVTYYDTVKNKFKDALGISEVKVYPNPIAANSNFNINFNLKDAGDYIVQFTDASGKIINSKQIFIAAKSQVESFNGNMFGAHGVYFVSVRGKQNNKIFTTKLVVQ
jgi:hypothetical protein